MKNDFFIYRLLFSIENRLGVDSLLLIGFEYSQIAQLMKVCFEQELVYNDLKMGITLTKKGEETLKKLSSSIFENAPSKWILPHDEHRINKIDKFAVYLPKKKG